MAWQKFLKINEFGVFLIVYTEVVQYQKRMLETGLDKGSVQYRKSLSGTWSNEEVNLLSHRLSNVTLWLVGECSLVTGSCWYCFSRAWRDVLWGVVTLSAQGMLSQARRGTGVAVSSSFPNKGVAWAAERLQGCWCGGAQQNAAVLELAGQRRQCRCPGRMGTREVFLEFCLSPALGVLLRKNRQLRGIWPPAQLSGCSYRGGRCPLCPVVGHCCLSLAVVGNRYKQGQSAWEVIFLSGWSLFGKMKCVMREVGSRGVFLTFVFM